MDQIKVTLIVLVLLLGPVQPGPAQVIQHDSLALVDIYLEMGGDQWVNNSQWLSLRPVDDWFGVTVSNGRVTKLQLISNNLVGSVPPSIGDLIGLEWLRIGDNHIVSLPPQIGNLSHLKLFTFWENQIEELPQAFAELDSVQHLDISENPFPTLPLEIFDLENLEFLFMATMPEWLTEVPPELGNLTNLKELFIVKSHWKTLPSTIGNLDNLEGIWASECKLVTLPIELYSLTKLDLLDLHDNQIADTLPAEIENLVNIRNIQLYFNQISGTIPEEMGNLQNLEDLNLGLNNLSGAVPASFTNLSDLRWLVLGNNQLTHLPDLSSLNNLLVIGVPFNRLTFEDIEPNLGVASSFTYTPQDSVGQSWDTTLTVGQPFMLSVDVGGSANVYAWRRNRLFISGANQPVFQIDSVVLANSGTYDCVISNTLCTELVLYSRPVTLTVDDQVGIDEPILFPKEYELRQNYPNPFNGGTVISYALPEACYVRLDVYNNTGQLVDTLVAGYGTAGNHVVTWEPKGLASGTYIYRLRAGPFTASKKLVYVK